MTEIKLGDPDPTPVLDSNWDYCWAPTFGVLSYRAVHCSWNREDHAERPHVWIGPESVVSHVWTDEEPPDGRVWGPSEIYPQCVGPRAGQSSDDWTNELMKLGSARGVNRQCSIGWHAECSDRAGDECRCACHGPVS